jgi:hypothetical protein
MADDRELPYGEDAAGRLVRAADVPRGDACGCVCPDCRRPFQTHQGPKRPWHFQHKPAPGQPASCAGYPETMLHRLAKQTIADAGELWLPALVARHQHYREEIQPARRVAISDARLEPHLGQIKPDLIATSANRELIIEVAVTHKAEPAKLAWLASNERPAIELDLSAGRDMAADAIADFILREAPRIWLWHRDQAAIDAALAAEIAAKLAAQRARIERETAEREARRARELARIEQWEHEAAERRTAAEFRRQEQLAAQRAEQERYNAALGHRRMIEQAARDAEQERAAAPERAKRQAAYDAMVAIERARIRKQMTGEITLAESLVAANRDAERRTKRNAELFGPDWQRRR